MDDSKMVNALSMMEPFQLQELLAKVVNKVNKEKGKIQFVNSIYKKKILGLGQMNLFKIHLSTKVGFIELLIFIVNQQNYLKQKLIKGQCIEVGSYKQNLLPGRDCSESYQCQSALCQNKVCKGLTFNQTCIFHSDCDPGLYCMLQNKWPFRSTCQYIKGDLQVCDEDLECQNDHYCWYYSATDRSSNIKKCLPIYSQSDLTRFGWYSNSTIDITMNDYIQNGKYCQSGLAYPVSAIEAKCTSTSQIIFNKQQLQDPYKCDPKLFQQKCQIQFNIESQDYAFASQGSRSYAETPCKCAMSDATTGFCGSIIGTDQYKKAIAATKSLFQVSKCHTLDRDNINAQKDTCGTGNTQDLWKNAVQRNFNITYWPYIQNGGQYNCILSFFGDSYENLSLFAKQFGMQAVGLSLLIGIFYF